MKRLLLFVLCSFQAIAQMGSISGVTVDAFNGTALANVPVKLLSSLDTSLAFDTFSDKLGRFKISNIKPGYYGAEVTLAGYHRVTAVINGELVSAVQLKPASQIEGFRVLLSKDTTLTARATDEHGVPLAGAQVLVRPIWVRGDGIIRESRDGYTGDGGECRFVLTPGRYRVLTRWYSPLPTPSETILRGLMYDAAEAEVEVSADLGARIDLPMHRRPAPEEDGSISGKVKGRPDGPTYTSVWLQSGPSPDTLRSAGGVALKPGDTSFQFTELKHEFHRIYATCCGNQSSLHSQVVDLSPNDEKREAVELTLAPVFSIRGSVAWAETKSELRESIWLRPVQSRAESEMYCCPHSTGSVITDPSFEIPHVAPDVYRVYFYDRHSNIYVKQVFLGDAELKDGILDLRNGNPHAELKVVASLNAGRLRVNLTDENGHPNGKGIVRLLQEGGFDPGRTWSPNWRAGSACGFYGLPPGKYKIVWTDAPITYLMELDPEWLKKNSNGAPEIEINESLGEREEQVKTLTRMLQP